MDVLSKIVVCVCVVVTVYYVAVVENVIVHSYNAVCQIYVILHVHASS